MHFQYGNAAFPDFAHFQSGNASTPVLKMHFQYGNGQSLEMGKDNIIAEIGKVWKCIYTRKDAAISSMEAEYIAMSGCCALIL
ncbi:hypothetical protein Tco_0329562 [Tanacetum coccineum]